MKTSLVAETSTWSQQNINMENRTVGKSYLCFRIIWLFMSLIMLVNYAQAQGEGLFFTFENELHQTAIEIDTISNPNNCWQIGTPGKTIFNAAFSPPNAILTDTINSYPPNDTSFFIVSYYFEFWATSFLGGGGLLFYFSYKVDTDSLSDYGFIEFSPDNGTSWLSIMKDSVFSPTGYIYWDTNSDNPIFTGNSGGWRTSSVVLDLGPHYNIEVGDTILFRFGFISDSIDTNREGWLIDDIHVIDMWLNMNDYSLHPTIKVYPNPSNGLLNVETLNQSGIEEVAVYNNLGQVLRTQVYASHTYSSQIDLQDFPPGIYFLRVTTQDKQVGFERFVKD